MTKDPTKTDITHIIFVFIISVGIYIGIRIVSTTPMSNKI